MEMISTSRGRMRKRKEERVCERERCGSCAIGNPEISHQSNQGPERRVDRCIHYRQDDGGRTHGPFPTTLLARLPCEY